MAKPMDRSLAGYSPWDPRESDVTEQLTHTHSLTLLPYSSFPLPLGTNNLFSFFFFPISMGLPILDVSYM